MAKNGSGAEVTRPLKHRPNVLVIVNGDGRRKIVGDGAPFSPAEFEVLHGGLAPSTSVRISDHFTDDERAELDALEQQLARAIAARDRVRAKLEDARHREAQAQTTAEFEAIGAEAQQLYGELEDVRRLESEARVALTKAQQRITHATRMRVDPPRYANLPDDRGLDERLDEVNR